MSYDKQQIEEMAKVLCNHCAGREYPCTIAKSGKMCRAIYREAEALYNDGYRKQSEGEWKLGKSGCMYFCSSCGYAAHPREEEEWSYCPACGARMKGEKNEKNHRDLFLRCVQEGD